MRVRITHPVIILAHRFCSFLIEGEIGKKEKADAQPFIPKKKADGERDNPREGWEDGTPPPHRDFKERCVVR